MSDALAVQGVTYSSLAEEFGTPLYLYDSAVLAAQYQGLQRALNSGLEYFFSLKANPNISICARLRALGAKAEVSSLTELMTARRAGVEGRDIIFLGPGKGPAEIAACLDERIYAIVCESFGELRVIDDLARSRGIVAPVALRVNPAFTVKGARLIMGGRSRQFGIDEQALAERPDLARSHSSVRLLGIHAYLGTRILDPAVIAENSRRVIAMAVQLSARLDFPLAMVDIGGGLGVAYFDNETDLDVPDLAARLNPVIGEFRAGHPDTRMIMELGRYLTAQAGTYVARVRYVKESMGESFAVTDGGTHHHMAAVGVGSFVKRNFPIRLLSRVSHEAPVPWQVSGPLCTPNDLLGKNIPLPPLLPGDLIGVMRSGAYGPSASPGYFLSHGYPAEVLVHDGRPHLIRDRDRPADLLRRQRLYDHAESSGQRVPAVAG